MRVLYVEDDEDTRTLVLVVLRSEGWEVVALSYNVGAAYKLANSSEFDLYLLDNRIEGDRQNTLCRALRSLHPSHSNTFLFGCGVSL